MGESRRGEVGHERVVLPTFSVRRMDLHVKVVVVTGVCRDEQVLVPIFGRGVMKFKGHRSWLTIFLERWYAMEKAESEGK